MVQLRVLRPQLRSWVRQIFNGNAKDTPRTSPGMESMGDSGNKSKTLRGARQMPELLPTFRYHSEHALQGSGHDQRATTLGTEGPRLRQQGERYIERNL